MYNILLFLAVIIFPVYAHASLVINEVMYDLSDGSDTDREWVEIYNNGENEINISGWKFNDGSNHVLNEPPKNGGQGSMVIPAGGFALLAADANAFLNDNPGFSGTVIDTVMSLGNTSETLSLINNSGANIDTFSYSKEQGGAGDGATLSLFNGIWKSGKPTPGLLNEEFIIIEENPSGENQTNNPSGGFVSSQEKTKYVEPKMSGVLSIPNRVMVGIPFIIDTKVFGFSEENIRRGYFSWSFGDGYRKESELLEKISHTYYDTGEYVLFFEYRRSPYNIEPDFSLRSTIRVIPPGVFISSISPEGNVVIENKSQYEVDLSLWHLISEGISFQIPKNTIVLPAKKITFRSSVTFFSPGISSASLSNPNAEVVSSYPSVNIKIVSSNTKKTIKSSSRTQRIIEPTEERSEVLDLDNILSAKPKDNALNPNIYISLLVLLILGAILISVFIKSKKSSSEDKAESTADDYTIIE
jgi:hypothetical protein